MEEMERMENKRHMEDEIDLLDLAKKLLRYWWIFLLAALIGGGGAGAYSTMMIAPQYQAECMIYVNNGAISVGATSVSLQDLNASQSLVDTYMVILKSRKVLMEVAEEAGVDYTYETLKSMVSASKVSDTEVFSVYVKSTDPVEAEHIANTIAQVLPDKIADIVEGSSVKIVDYAVVPANKISPSNTKNALMGAMALLVLAGLLATLRILLDTSIQSDEDLFAITRYPLLAKIPEQAPGKKQKSKDKEKSSGYIGKDVNFNIREAYRLLRTNVIYSLAHENKGKIIGVTSSVAAEYKTTTAINLALNLAGEKDKKVLLLDCDLRMSEIAQRLNLSNEKGLAEYLTSDVKLSSIIQFKEEYPNLAVIVGGNSSPNPDELLCSRRMKDCFVHLSKHFDYVIADFPPANIVSDALELGKDCDGMIMVVRQKYTEKKALEESLRKLKFLSINVLGLVFTGTEGNSGRYKKQYYKKYYGNYKSSEK